MQARQGRAADLQAFVQLLRDLQHLAPLLAGSLLRFPQLAPEPLLRRVSRCLNRLQLLRRLLRCSSSLRVAACAEQQ